MVMTDWVMAHLKKAVHLLLKNKNLDGYAGSLQKQDTKINLHTNL